MFLSASLSHMKFCNWDQHLVEVLWLHKQSGGLWTWRKDQGDAVWAKPRRRNGWVNLYNNFIIAHGCLSADCFLEAVSSTDAEEKAGREQLSGGINWERVPGPLGLHLTLWRWRKVNINWGSRRKKYVQKCDLFFSYFNDFIDPCDLCCA